MVYEQEVNIYKNDAIGDGIEDAGNHAHNYVTDITDAGIFVHQNDGGNHTAPTAPNARGVKISDTVDIIRDGKVMAEFGGGDGDAIILGDESITDGMLFMTDSDSMSFYRVRKNSMGDDWKDTLFTYRTVTAGAFTWYVETVPVVNIDDVNVAVTSHSNIVSVSAAYLIIGDNQYDVGINYVLQDGLCTITESVYYNLTGRSKAINGDKIRIAYQSRDRFYFPQLWLGNVKPEADIFFQTPKADNTPGFTVDYTGSINAANIDSGTSEEVAIANGSDTTVTVTFGKEFPSVPIVVCSLTQIKNTDNQPKLTDVHQLVVQTTAVGLNSASFSIRNNGTLNRRAKISWMAFAN